MKTLPPQNVDWQEWIQRWDRMQERHIVHRAERFETIIGLIKNTQESVSKIVDLGCGTGSLTNAVLDAFPNTQVFGLDFDQTLLWLAKPRLEKYDDRVTLVLVDLRQESWSEHVKAPIDAVVSATALHWFKPDELANLYGQLADILRPGGIFLNADHAASSSPVIQQAWERHRAEVQAAQDQVGEEWEAFWTAYCAALGMDCTQIYQRVLGSWEGGVEEGLPLAWHLDKLRENGFMHVDCFWRCDTDAIYGGIV